VHPEEHDLLLYLEDKLSSAERAGIEAHLGGCGECAHKFAALVRLPQILDKPAPHDLSEHMLRKAIKLVRPGGSPRWSGFKLFTPPIRIALAGAAVVAIAMTTFLLAPRNQPTQFRTDKAEQGPTFRLYPEDGATVHAKRPAFRWNAIGESTVYRFSLTDDAGAIVWISDRRDTSLELPASVVLQSGKTYLWRVETFFADKTLERSALHVFTYLPQE
jgi:hypothetical protein